ncbi:MAG TPA: extradiol ring-cleavage dioxygenase [Candidatus Binatia bacterium]
MAKLVAAMASSHAFTLLDPEKWDQHRERNRGGYKRRYGVEPPVHPKVAEESLEENRPRYQHVKSGLDFLRQKLKEKKLDALILVGDDQSENFKEDNLPQIALYVGEEFLATERGQSGGNRYRSHAGLARNLLDGLVEREFDVSFSESFPNSELLSHAHAPILKTIAPEADVPVVLLFVNAIHMPAISPGRCYRIGQAIREIIDRRGGAERVALYASGGLSHFTGGYPWPHYQGNHTYGSISEEFDRQALELMARGEGEKLSGLSTCDLLDHGDIEMRSWITLLGAVGKTPAKVLAYEPFYRAIMGMAVAYWELEN